MIQKILQVNKHSYTRRKHSMQSSLPISCSMFEVNFKKKSLKPVDYMTVMKELIITVYEILGLLTAT